MEPVTVVPSMDRPATRSVCWSVMDHGVVVPSVPASREPSGVRL
ncbi:hypothetical protein [Streptomyces sp. UG1]